MYNDDIKKQAVSLYESGMNASRIAKKIGCSSTSVINWIKKSTIINNNQNDNNKNLSILLKEIIDNFNVESDIEITIIKLKKSNIKN